ncbi:sensor histidine kinase [Paracoccus rhizosphaerae]|uniref:histidine kinase n=1 Tax=Paracoccus rhizosphaerae TaxID=1133347 RepID=A0ABV6CEQ9_9RHOB|nr:ATP-binding protein [Paracoccus rhizosphaerae]
MASVTGDMSRHDSRPWLVLVCLMLAVLIPAATYRLTQAAAMARLQDTAAVAAQTRALALDSLLDRQRAVAAVLAVDQQVVEALRSRALADVAVSAKLDLLRDETQSSVIYLLDAGGRAIAASNWDQPVSFVGHDYGFREYFREALASGTGQEYGLGTVSGRPGLYLAHDVRADGQTMGVIVVKVEFDALEAAWARDPAGTYVTDETGQVIISSQPQLRFQPLPPVPDGGLVQAPVRRTDWRLAVQVPTSAAGRVAALAAGTALLATLLAGVAAALISARLRRAARRTRAEAAYRADLERAVAARTSALSDEMRERQAAEQRLAQLQSDLVQANKLATLGQVTAGFAHEVNQPLATIRLLAENGAGMLQDKAPPVRENLDRIVGMTDRIGQITSELRSFSRKATGAVQAVSLRDAVEASMMLTASRRRASGMAFDLPPIPPNLCVRAEAVRLEQILVNLLTNAHDAQEGRPDPRIRIALDEGPAAIDLTISDNGPGISAEMAAQLFTPFATDKPQGLGLGLVISRDIARDFGGELDVLPPAEGRGAAFRLTLPRAA